MTPPPPADFASASDSSQGAAPRLAGKRLAFIVTEDWFFASHFLPMARAAGELGLEVAVIARVREHRSAIEATGAKVIPLEAERRSLNPMAAGYAAGQLAAVLRAWKPDLVHCIALRPILVGGSAALMAGVSRRVYALPGLGFLRARDDLVARGARRAIPLLVRMLETKETHYLFENPDDPRLLGLDPADAARVTIVGGAVGPPPAEAGGATIVGGAGADPGLSPPHPLPPQPPLKVAVIARMLWSKGIDVAVEAARLARSRGAAVELSLFGAPDASNPKCIP